MPLVGEVVAVPGLIVDDRDGAGRGGTEGVLGGGVGVAAPAEQADIPGFAVGGTLNLVQFAVVGREKCTYGAMSGDARGVGGSINVARQLQFLFLFRLLLVAAISSGNNVGLDSIISCIRWEAGRHGSFEETLRWRSCCCHHQFPERCPLLGAWASIHLGWPPVHRTKWSGGLVAHRHL